jgi:hypothetical protein
MSANDMTIWIVMAIVFAAAAAFLKVKTDKMIHKVQKTISIEDDREFLSAVRDLVVEYNKSVSSFIRRNKRLRGHILNEDALEELHEKQALTGDEVYEAFNNNLLTPVLINALSMEARFKLIGLLLLLVVILIIGALSFFGLRLPSNYPWILLFAYGAPVGFMLVTYTTEKQGLKFFKELRRDFARRIGREAPTRPR